MASIDSGELAKKEENAIVVDVAPFIAQGTLASSRRDGAPPISDETDRIGLDERMRSYLRDYFLGA